MGNLLPATVMLTAGLCCAANAALLPNYTHYETVTNNTGTAANDITLSLPHPSVAVAGFSLSSTAFAGGTFTGLGTDTVTITGPAGSSVAGNGGTDKVGWISKYASDVLLADSFWTFNGANIGAVTLNNPVGLNATDNGNGTITVSVDNMSSFAQAYSSLSVSNGAPASDYDAADAYADMGLGSPVSLLIPSSGTLAPGSHGYSDIRAVGDRIRR